MELADLTTVGGLAVVVVLALQALVKPFLSGEQISKYGPALAAALGVIIGTAAAIYLGGPLGEAVLRGFLAGCGAAGLYDLAKPPIANILS
jgi:hypothetical protein